MSYLYLFIVELFILYIYPISPLPSSHEPTQLGFCSSTKTTRNDLQIVKPTGQFSLFIPFDQPAIFDTDYFLLLEILYSLNFQNILTTPSWSSFSWTSLCCSAPSLSLRTFSLLSPTPLWSHLIIALNTIYADDSQVYISSPDCSAELQTHISKCLLCNI